MSQKRYTFLCTFAMSVCLLLKAPASYGSSSLCGPSPQSKADQDMFEIAAPHHSTMKLMAHTPFGEFFSGSATYIGQNKEGDYIALTNAHCVEFWYRATKFLASFTIDHVTEEGTEQFCITDIEFHPQWFSSQKNLNYDVVKLKLDQKTIPNNSLTTPVNYNFHLKTIEIPKTVDFDESILGPRPKLPPEYEELKKSSRPEDKKRMEKIFIKFLDDLDAYKEREASAREEHEKRKDVNYKEYMEFLEYFDPQSFVSVGFGTDGPCTNMHFAKNDQKKRGTSVRLRRKAVNTHNACRTIRSEPLGHKFNANTQKFEDVTTSNEYGTRYGMSGGGLYRFIGNNQEPGYELIGINKSKSHISTSRVYYAIQRTKSYYQNYLGKYIAAAGIPTPFINPVKGQYSVFLSLSPLEDWINSPFSANGQTTKQYLHSWFPGKTTSAALTTTASAIGYGIWSYFR